MRNSRELVFYLRRLLGRRPLPSPARPAPGCAFGAVVEERLGNLERRLEEMRGQLYGLFSLVAGAVVVEVVLRLMR